MGTQGTCMSGEVDGRRVQQFGDGSDESGQGVRGGRRQIVRRERGAEEGAVPQKHAKRLEDEGALRVRSTRTLKY